MEKKHTVLFTQKNSIYQQLNCDCWDINRNALNYLETNYEPVIAHPPCRQFSRLRKFSKHDASEYSTVQASLEYTKKNGGILEHPSGTSLFKIVDGYDANSGFTLAIDQYWFGHPAQKKTWLYIKGIKKEQIPAFPIVLGKAKGKVESLSKKDRDATPLQFAQWLIKILERIKND